MRQRLPNATVLRAASCRLGHPVHLDAAIAKWIQRRFSTKAWRAVRCLVFTAEVCSLVFSLWRLQVISSCTVAFGKKGKRRRRGGKHVVEGIEGDITQAVNSIAPTVGLGTLKQYQTIVFLNARIYPDPHFVFGLAIYLH